MRHSIILLLVMLATLTTYGQRRSRTSAQPRAVASRIRRIDFRNFTYSLEDGTTISVRRRKWSEKSPEMFGGIWDFEVTQVLYGDLTGDGQEEAFIVAEGADNYGASGWNSRLGRYFIYAMNDGKPELLSVFKYSDLDDLYAPFAKTDSCDGRVMFSKSQGIQSGIISLAVEIAGPVCVGPTVLMRIRLDGSRLVLVGRPVKQSRKK